MRLFSGDHCFTREYTVTGAAATATDVEFNKKSSNSNTNTLNTNGLFSRETVTPFNGFVYFMPSHHSGRIVLLLPVELFITMNGQITDNRTTK